jgi:hypothetical protein
MMRQTLRLTATILISSLTLAVPMLAAPQQAQSAPAKPAAAAPAPPQAPCTAPESKQFDFWVGEWDVTWTGSEGQPGGTATNRVEKTLGGCAVEEHFTGVTGNNLAGHSVSLYSVRDKAWKQTWVDNQGGYIDLTGEFKDGAMTLVHHGTTLDGKPLMSRMVYTNIKPDSFDWRWESSRDGGATWKILWPLHYQRKGTSPKG